MSGLNVLVVDDSAVVREALGEVLSGHGMTVATAADPVIALDKLRLRRPDVIVLDLDMPRMDGLTFLRRVMDADPLPVVVCSAVGGPGTMAAMEALAEGAVDVVGKPRLGVKDFIHDSSLALVEAVRGAAAAKVFLRRGGLKKNSADVVLPKAPAGRGGAGLVAALGASTGGTEALHAVLSSLPEESPALVIVQHMPEGFTRAFAERLDRTCRMEVKEAADGDEVRPGRALVAAGNRHLVVSREGERLMARLADGPLVSRHRPSVDVLFRSVAQAAGAGALGVLMTGMGDDGAQGLLEMKQAGAETAVQDEATCVVFGMPKEALARGAAQLALPLPGIPAWILDRVRNRARRG